MKSRDDESCEGGVQGSVSLLMRASDSRSLAPSQSRPADSLTATEVSVVKPATSPLAQRFGELLEEGNAPGADALVLTGSRGGTDHGALAAALTGACACPQSVCPKSVSRRRGGPANGHQLSCQLRHRLPRRNAPARCARPPARGQDLSAAARAANAGSWWSPDARPVSPMQALRSPAATCVLSCARLPRRSPWHPPSSKCAACRHICSQE